MKHDHRSEKRIDCEETPFRRFEPVRELLKCNWASKTASHAQPWLKMLFPFPRTK